MFYTFRQNNSGGEYDINDKVNEIVIVEAESADEANLKAEEVGIYFNGVENDLDCECCGDRWDAICEEAEGFDVPTYYDRPITKVGSKQTNKTDVVIYYKDGSRQYAVAPFYEWNEDAGAYEWSN